MKTLLLLSTMAACAAMAAAPKNDGSVTLCSQSKILASTAKPVTVAGRDAWQSSQPKKKSPNRSFYFDVQDPLLKNGNAKTVTITLSYLDNHKANVSLHYDSSDTSTKSALGDGVMKQAETFTTGNSGEWKTFSWVLNDARFASRCHGHDFRILVGADANFVIEGCKLSGKPKLTTVMPDVFSDAMILQRESDIPVWGQAKDGTQVTVSFAGKTLKTTAKDAEWSLAFPPMKANKTPQTMTVSASDGFKKTFKNILIGDVWLASGQSNMAMNLAASKTGKEVIASSTNPLLRLYTVPRYLENTVPPIGTSWKESTPHTSASQSAIGYFFVNELQKKLNIPVGLLNCSYGGTVTETWCGPDVMSQSWPDWERNEKRVLPNPNYATRNKYSSHLYKRMLKTVMPFPVKGFIWYQGEGNASRAEEQKKLFPAMVAGWRKDWGNDKLPFYIVQLARYEAANWHAFRCAQLDVWQNTPNTYMAVTIDLSKEPSNHPIHPKVKAPIAHRLALAARANVYGETKLVYSGPIVRDMTVANGSVTLTFDHSGSGLAVSDAKPLRGFFVSSDGEAFAPAIAKIKDNSIVLSSDKVPTPVAVRYGAEADMGKKNLDLNLINKETLPASPFTIRSNQ